MGFYHLKTADFSVLSSKCDKGFAKQRQLDFLSLCKNFILYVNWSVKYLREKDKSNSWGVCGMYFPEGIASAEAKQLNSTIL